MPLKRCEKDGEGGWKWGEEGTCYTGPRAKTRALKQAVAIMKNEGKSDDAIEKALKRGQD